ncbi:MAG: Coenzyme PQQ synthesis protein E [Myxococcota bacterium]|nr:Coenzyme PQQ synthesis protein E [Myxococcota bacterium]
MPRDFFDRLRLMRHYLNGGGPVPGPSSILIETTNRCNLFCPMCPRTGQANLQKDMDSGLLFSLIDEFARLGGDHVYLYGLGEPFLDQRIFDILARCRRRGLGTILSTNATLLNARRRKQFLDTGCDYLLIGLDGATRETYSRYRHGGDFDEVTGNVRELAREKHTRNIPMTLTVQFIRMPGNLHEQDQFIDCWSKVPGVDSIRIKDEDIGIPDHALYEEDGHLRKNPCFLLWRGPLVIRCNGDVYPCYHYADHGEPIGNIWRQPLESLWNSPAMQSLRELHLQRRAAQDRLCASCACARPRLPFVLGAMALRGTTVRRLVPLAERAALTWQGLFSETRLKKARPE